MYRVKDGISGTVIEEWKALKLINSCAWASESAMEELFERFNEGLYTFEYKQFTTTPNDNKWKSQGKSRLTVKKEEEPFLVFEIDLRDDEGHEDNAVRGKSFDILGQYRSRFPRHAIHGAYERGIYVYNYADYIKTEAVDKVNLDDFLEDDTMTEYDAEWKPTKENLAYMYETPNADELIMAIAYFYERIEQNKLGYQFPIEIEVSCLNPYWLVHDILHALADCSYPYLNIDDESEHQRLIEAQEISRELGFELNWRYADALCKQFNTRRFGWDKAKVKLTLENLGHKHEEEYAKVE